MKKDDWTTAMVLALSFAAWESRSDVINRLTAKHCKNGQMRRYRSSLLNLYINFVIKIMNCIVCTAAIQQSPCLVFQSSSRWQ